MKIYNPLGLSGPTTLEEKVLYRVVSESQSPWDQVFSKKHTTNRQMWGKSLPDKVEVPWSIVQHQEEINSISLHAFCDISSWGLSAAVYAVMHQPSGILQGLVAAKSRITRKGLTILRLELVAGHMATNLVLNAKETLQRFLITSFHC